MRAPMLYLAGFLTAAGASPASLGVTSSAPATAFSASAQTAAGPAGAKAVGIPRASDGLFYADAAVPAGRVRFLVDTGATHLILSHEDASRAAGRSASKPSSVIQTAGGPVKVRWVVLDRIEIAGVTLTNVEAAIPDRDVGLSLLGQNALAQFSKIEINGDELVLRR